MQFVCLFQLNTKNLILNRRFIFYSQSSVEIRYFFHNHCWLEFYRNYWFLLYKWVQFVSFYRLNTKYILENGKFRFYSQSSVDTFLFKIILDWNIFWTEGILLTILIWIQNTGCLIQNRKFKFYFQLSDEIFLFKIIFDWNIFRTEDILLTFLI